MMTQGWRHQPKMYRKPQVVAIPTTSLIADQIMYSLTCFNVVRVSRWLERKATTQQARYHGLHSTLLLMMTQGWRHQSRIPSKASSRCCTTLLSDQSCIHSPALIAVTREGRLQLSKQDIKAYIASCWRWSRKNGDIRQNSIESLKSLLYLPHPHGGLNHAFTHLL